MRVYYAGVERRLPKDVYIYISWNVWIKRRRRRTLRGLERLLFRDFDLLHNDQPAQVYADLGKKREKKKKRTRDLSHARAVVFPDSMIRPSNRKRRGRRAHTLPFRETFLRDERAPNSASNDGVGLEHSDSKFFK